MSRHRTMRNKHSNSTTTTQTRWLIQVGLQNDRIFQLQILNAGNIAYLNGELDKAATLYKEALNNEATCVQVRRILIFRKKTN